MEINKKTGEYERKVKPCEKCFGYIVVLLLVVIFAYSLVTKPVDESGFENTGGFCYGAGTWDCLN
jgi:uncharacterized PurR-regulated membrane protein YhhQ (DUF165 family)